MVYLHIGCGNRKLEGFINTDKEMDISQPWPHADESVDGIVSMQVFQQLYWRDLMVAFKEAYRVLKKGGVMRFGTMLVENNPADYALGWKNINLFTFDLLDMVLGEVGFTHIYHRRYRESAIPELAKADNRAIGKGTAYIEVIK